MAKTKRIFIFATFIISCLATIISIVSISTEEWVSGSLKPNIKIFKEANLNYGLFKGSMFQKLLVSTSTVYKITIACFFAENICGFSFQEKGEERQQEIEDIHKGLFCDKAKSNYNIYNAISSEIENNDIEYISKEDNFDIELLDRKNEVDFMRYINMQKAETTTEIDITDSKCDLSFINGGLWVVTIFFLSLTIVMSAMTATLSVVNTAGNPISPWLNIWGLYIWNILSSIFALLTLIFWGSLFASSIQNNVAVGYTLIGYYSNDDISLGYSYWMILAPLLLPMINCGLLYLRQYFIEREPEISEEKIDNADKDGMIFVY